MWNAFILNNNSLQVAYWSHYNSFQLSTTYCFGESYRDFWHFPRWVSLNSLMYNFPKWSATHYKSGNIRCKYCVPNHFGTLCIKATVNVFVQILFRVTSLTKKTCTDGHQEFLLQMMLLVCLFDQQRTRFPLYVTAAVILLFCFLHFFGYFLSHWKKVSIENLFLQIRKINKNLGNSLFIIFLRCCSKSILILLKSNYSRLKVLRYMTAMIAWKLL